jgi:chromosome condensin MukBEF complex kleisin-like MukF subunit
VVYIDPTPAVSRDNHSLLVPLWFGAHALSVVGVSALVGACVLSIAARCFVARLMRPVHNLVDRPQLLVRINANRLLEQRNKEIQHHGKIGLYGQ